MIPEIRLVALDLDGTLLTSAGTLPPQGAALLTKAAQNVHIVLATTRNFESASRFYRMLELNAPLVCANGAQVWATVDGPLWAEYCIEKGVAHAIAQFADEQNWELGITVGQMNYWRQRPGQPLGEHAPNIMIVATNADAIVGEPLRILTWQAEAIKGIGNFCRSELRDQCSVEIYMNPAGKPHSLGIFAPLANKGTAIHLIMQRLGVTREQVVTIGDNFNDLAMFGCGNVSVAMANAPEAVRRQASLIAPSNDDEGVTWIMKQLQIV